MPLFARAMLAFLNWQAARGGLQPEGTTDEAAEGRERRRTGLRGETFAYWYLRRQGYTVVGRNYRVPDRHGEIDLIGWDGPVLAFVEVKTRTTATGGPPEQAVDPGKQRLLQAMARYYLARYRPARRSPVAQPAPQETGEGELRYRFDVLAIEAKAGAAPVVRLHKGAFGAN